MTESIKFLNDKLKSSNQFYNYFTLSRSDKYELYHLIRKDIENAKTTSKII